MYSTASSRLRLSLVRAFNYRRVRVTIQTGFHNGGRNYSLVAYESGRKECFDCTNLQSTCNFILSYLSYL